MDIYKYIGDTHLGPGVESHFFSVDSLVHASPLHTHDFFEMFLVTSGAAVHVVNGTKTSLHAGMLVFIRPDDVHAYDYLGDQDCSFINIGITSEGMDKVFRFLGEAFEPHRLLSPALPPCATLTVLEKETITARLTRIRAVYSTEKPMQEMQLRTLIVDMLVQHFQNIERTTDLQMPAWLEELLICMQRKEHFTVGMPRLYELSGRSTGYINRVFKQRLHMTPVSYINQLKLGYAKDLLITTRLRITDVAYTVGFNNLSHFHHLFKAAFGRTPLEYRIHSGESKAR